MRIESAVWLSPVSLHPARHQRDQHVCKIAQHIGLLQKSYHRRHHRKLEESIFADFGNWEFLEPGTVKCQQTPLHHNHCIIGWSHQQNFRHCHQMIASSDSVSQDANTQVTKKLGTLQDFHSACQFHLGTSANHKTRNGPKLYLHNPMT